MKLNKTQKTKVSGILKNQRGQGATEYILLLLVVVAIAFAFKEQILGAVKGKLDQVSGDIGNFTGQ